MCVCVQAHVCSVPDIRGQGADPEPAPAPQLTHHVSRDVALLLSEHHVQGRHGLQGQDEGRTLLGTGGTGCVQASVDVDKQMPSC